MSNPLKRIKHYLDYKDIRISTFEKSTGLSNGSFGGQLKKNRSIGTDKLENIVRKYTDLNANWVLTGEGEMLKASPSEGATNEQHPYEQTIKSLNEVIAAQQKTIETLEKLVKQGTAKSSS